MVFSERWMASFRVIDHHEETALNFVVSHLLMVLFLESGYYFAILHSHACKLRYQYYAHSFLF